MNSRRTWLALLGVAAGAVLIILGYLIWSGYREAILAAEVTTRGYAATLEARLAASLRRADAELQKLARTLRPADLTQNAATSPGDLDELLRRSLINFPDLGAISIFDANGDTLYTSHADSSRPNIADRKHFRIVRDNMLTDSVFSEVIIARNSGRPSLTLTRALRDDRGQFHGVVVALVDLEYFLNLFKSLNIDARSTVAIYRSDDFSQVLRWPALPDKVNVPLPANSPVRAALSGSKRTATLELTASTDGILRIYSYHALQAYPFYIAVGLARDDALAQWRQRSLVTATSTLVLLGLLLGLLFRLGKADAERAKLAAIVEGSNEAIFSRSLDGTILSWNAGAQRMLGYTPAEAIGKPGDFAVPADRPSNQVSNSEKLLRGEIVQHETDRVTKDGRRVNVFTSHSPVKDSAGKIIGISVIMRDITALKQAQAAIKESEERFRATFEQAAVGIAHFDLQDINIRVNRRYCEITGYPAEMLVGKSPRFLSHPDDHGSGAEQRKLLHAGRINQFANEKRYCRKDGAVIWVRRTESLVRDDAGAALYCVRVIEDITDRKRTEEALRESETRFRDIADAAGSYIWEVDLKVRYTFMSDRAEKLFGYLPEEMLGRTPAEFMPPGEAARIDAWIDAHKLADGTVRSFEHRSLTKTGQIFWQQVHRAPRYDATGALIGYRGTGVDITERKHAEAALETAARRLEIALEGSGISVWEANLASNEIWMDSTWSELLGNAPVDTRSTAVELLDLVHPEDLQAVLAAATRTWKGETPIYAVDHRVRTTAGKWLWIHSRGRVTERDVSGRAVRMSGTNSDISERKQADDLRSTLEAQLRESQKMEAIGTLAGGIAHDFNNIVATIQGNAELASQDVAPGSHVMQCLEDIGKATAHARGLVRQILAFSRRQPTSLSPIRLAPVVEEMAQLLRATLPARLVLVVQCEDAAPPVMADVTQIQQALLNLATNAMQAIPSGPGTITISLAEVTLDADLLRQQAALRELRRRHPGPVICITVADDGPGMDADTLNRMFEPFFTTKPVGEGTGLGLSVVHGIVHGHQGAIVVSSAPGKGTRFAIYFPAAVAAPAKRQSVTQSLPATAPSEDRRLRVLHIDDDKMQLSLFKRLLERRGWRVKTCSEPAAALEILRADRTAFDLVITDYNMPQLSGLDVARAVRHIRADLPLIVLSGFIDEILHVQAEEAGVLALISKTDSVEAIFQSIRQHIQTIKDVTY